MRQSDVMAVIAQWAGSLVGYAEADLIALAAFLEARPRARGLARGARPARWWWGTCNNSTIGSHEFGVAAAHGVA